MESSIHVILPTVPSRSLRKELSLNPLYWSLYSLYQQKDVNLGYVILVEDTHKESHVENIEKIARKFKREGMDIIRIIAQEARTCGEVRNAGFRKLKKEGNEKSLVFNWEDDCFFASTKSLRALVDEISRSGSDVTTPSIHVRGVFWEDMNKKLFEKYSIRNLYGVIFEGMPTMDGHHNKSEEVFEKRGVGLIRGEICEKALDGNIYPYRTFDNGLGEEPLASVKLVTEGYKLYRTTKSLVIHLKFGRSKTHENELRGEVPFLDYELPISFKKMVEISKDPRSFSGCAVSPENYRIYYMAQILLLYSATHPFIGNLDKKLAKKLLKFHKINFAENEFVRSFKEYRNVWERIKGKFECDRSYVDIVYKRKSITPFLSNTYIIEI